MEQVWHSLDLGWRDVITMLGFGLIGYYIRLVFRFSRKYFEELGKQSAELALIKEKTVEIEEAKYPFNQALEEVKASHNKELEAVKASHNKELEAVKASHNKELEEHKASLGKENIVYQIHNAKYIELRFQRLDELYGKMYELTKYCQDNFKMFLNPADEQGLQDKVTKFYEHHEIAEDALYRARLYITDDKVSASVKNFLDETSIALQKFRRFYYGTVPHSSKTPPQAPIYLRDINDQPLVDMLFSVDELSDFLADIEIEFRRYLTIR